MYPNQGAAVLSCFGVLIFGLLGHVEWRYCSWQVVLAGFVGGATQYYANSLLRRALSLGPLSPAWCALSLNFVPVIVYAALFMGEHLSFCQYGALLATVGAILAASCNQGNGESASLKRFVPYILVLVGILVSGSVLSIILKAGTVYCVPGHDVALSNQTGKLLMCFTYFFLGIGCSAELSVGHHWIWNRQAVICCLGVSVAAISAYILTVQAVSRISAILLFAGSNATSILVASLSSVLFFHEKKSRAWFLTVLCAMLAILLNR